MQKSTAEQKRLLASTAYTIGGALVLNAALQLLVYPALNRRMGAAPLGNLLFLMGIVAILCPSIGQSLNTGRLVLRREFAVSNGDYNLAVLFFGAIGTFVSCLLARSSIRNPAAMLLFILLLFLTAFRYYGDVEYRLSLRYRGYFVYYVVVACGYLLGFGLYCLGLSWVFIFLVGEAAGLVFLALTGSVFHDFFKRSAFFSLVLQRESFLVASYLLTNMTLNVDRLALSALQGDLAVTQYYVVSLIGKTLVLLVAPINTILISYMTKRRIVLDRKGFFVFAGAGILVAFVFFIAAQLVTPLFVHLFYPDLYEAVHPLVGVVNAGQILGLLSAYLFMVVLTFTGEKWQFVLQCFHLLLLTLLIFTMGRTDLFGFSVAVLIANSVRIALVLILGMTKAGRSRLSWQNSSEK